MSMSEIEKLMETLDGSDRELVDIKFFPGQSRSLSAAHMAREAEKVTAQLFDDSIPHNPPATGLAKKAF